MDAKTIGAMLPNRPADSHKGTFGKAFIVAGSLNFIGAAYLAGGGAYRSGAGLVTLAIPQAILSPLASLLPEATWVLLPNDLGVINKAAAPVVREEVEGYQALLLGCGIGDEDETRDFMRQLLEPEEGPSKRPIRKMIGLLRLTEEDQDEAEPASPQKLPPLVIDADGLNALAKIESWPSLLPAHTILTPHPREMARLLGEEDVEKVLADREGLALQKAKEWGAVLVLKGAHTVIASPEGQSVISPFASAQLATAGTGDVLAGVIAGLLAQGMEPFQAAQAGVWLHGWAGTQGVAQYGALASEVLAALPQALAAAYGAA